MSGLYMKRSHREVDQSRGGFDQIVVNLMNLAQLFQHPNQLREREWRLQLALLLGSECESLDHFQS